jgi:hypothetical protein
MKLLRLSSRTRTIGKLKQTLRAAALPLTVRSTGIAGAIGVMHALVRRSEEGGSFGIDVSTHP